jgi:hypothetical protein
MFQSLTQIASLQTMLQDLKNLYYLNEISKRLIFDY